MKSNSKEKIYKLTLCAVMIALSSALSLIKVIQLPLGGGVTPFSMLPVVMISVVFGLGWGLASSFVYSLIQLIFGVTLSGLLGWGLSPLSLIGAIFIDYIFAYTFIGFSGIFRKKGTVGVCVGIVLALTARFLCHLVSGAIIFGIWCEWKSVWLYSLCYNGAYMLPEIIITAVGAGVLFNLPQIKKLIARLSKSGQ